MDVDPLADEATLLEAARSGDPGAFPALFERWFGHSRDLAETVLSARDDICGAITAGFRRAWQDLPDVGGDSFGAAVGMATRSHALARLDVGAAPVAPAMAGGFGTRDGTAAEDRLVACSAIDEAATDVDIVDLVRAASLALGPADRSLLVLRLRLGVSEQEIAAATGDQVHDVEQRLFRLRARLRAAVEAIVLWRGGRPVCDDLAGVVRQVSKGRFDRETAAAITDHAEACARCRQNKRLQLTPAALFAAIPSGDADPQLHDDVAASLNTSGVPVIASGSELEAAPDGSSSSGATAAGVTTADAAKERALARRGQIGALVGGAIVAIAVLLAALQPWGSSGEPQLGMLSSSSITTTPPRARASTTTGPAHRSTGGVTTTSTTTTRPARPTTSAPSASNRSAPPGTGHTTTTTTTAPTTRGPSTTRGSTLPAFVAASVDGGGVCADGTSTAVTVSWHARGATSVAVRGPSTNAINKPAIGQLGVCVPSLPASFTLTARGPGGAVSETLTVNGSQSTTTTSSTSSTTTSTTTPPSATTGGNPHVPGTANSRPGG